WGTLRFARVLHSGRHFPAWSTHATIVRSSTSSLSGAGEAENSFSALALRLVRPFLRQMIDVLLNDGKTGVVPIGGRFQSRHPGKGKCQSLLRIGNGGRD